MGVVIQTDCEGIDWAGVARILKTVEMASYDPEVHQKAFAASYAVAFAHEAGDLVGFGRAISDGAYQAALYDCAVAVSFQGQGVGSLIMEALLKRISGFNVILYASPGKEGFYRAHGFQNMKTGMVLFQNRAAMMARGFTE